MNLLIDPYRVKDMEKIMPQCYPLMDPCTICGFVLGGGYGSSKSIGSVFEGGSHSGTAQLFGFGTANIQPDAGADDQHAAQQSAPTKEFIEKQHADNRPEDHLGHADHADPR